MIDISDFDVIKEKGELLYKTIGEIYCPYFKEKISFNARGLEHLKFIQREKARLEIDQYMRFKLLHLAPEVLRLSRTVQGIFQTKHFERIRVHSRTDTILTPVTYYEFIAVLGTSRVKVIVKQIDNTQPIFWSLIPFWGIETSTKKRRLHAGDPESD